MPDLILHKRSLTPNSTPTTASLVVGELAINVNDGKVFLRRSGSLGDSIVPLVTTDITNSGSIIGNFTGSLFGTASFSSLAATASYYDTSSLLVTSSVLNATITFTKGNGSTYPITINNVINAQTASVLSGFNQNDYLTTSSFNLFTASYNTGSFSGSFVGTASFATNAGTASFYDTSSLLVTSSVSNATITFVKGNGLTYPITINNVINAETASVLTGFDQNDYVLLSAYNNFTSSYNTGSFSGSFIGTASFAQQAATASYVQIAQTASYYDTSSLLVTASISNATITLTKGNSTTFNLVVNNVVNAQTASYILNAVSSSYASNADLFDNRDSTTFANTGSNTFNGVQTFNQDITGTHAYFSGDVVINGTASIGMLETRNQQSLVVGDKYIVIMSGAVDHTTLDGSGILFGSGSSDPTSDENGANAYLRYRNAYDAVEAFPNFRVSGSLIVSSGSTITTISGTIAEFTEITASSILGTITTALTANYVETAQTASYYNTSSLLITSSISDATITFTKGNNSTYSLVVNNVVNAQTASYVLNAVSASFATNAATASTLSGFNQNDYVLLSTYNNFTASYNTGSFSGSFIGTASFASNSDLFDNRDSTTFANTGSNTFNGNQTITGTLNVSSVISGAVGQFNNITSSQVIIGTALYVTNTITTSVGDNIIYNVATSSYDGLFVDYTIRSGSNARAGNIMAIWSDTSVNYTETTTTNFGDTSGLLMNVSINGTNLQLSASATSANWIVKTIIRTI